MDAALLLPAVFSLIGVAVGSGGSIFAAYLATRTTREKAKSERIAALRDERKAFLLDYLRAAQNSHDFAAQLWNVDNSVRALPENVQRFSQLDSELWYQHKKLLLVSSPPLRDAATAWTELLTEATERPRSSECTFWKFIEPIQSHFIAAARQELGVVEGLSAS